MGLENHCTFVWKTYSYWQGPRFVLEYVTMGPHEKLWPLSLIYDYNFQYIRCGVFL